MALGVVSDGGLQISRVADPKGVDAITVVGVSSSSGIDWETPWDNYEDAIRNSMNNYFQSQLSNAENNLIYGLANQNKLFLPGSGTFLMNGAEMNARGDLIAGIHYNGYVTPSFEIPLCNLTTCTPPFNKLIYRSQCSATWAKAAAPSLLEGAPAAQATKSS